MKKNDYKYIKNIFFANIPIGIFLINYEKEILYSNQTILKYFGENWFIHKEFDEYFDYIIENVDENLIYEKTVEIAKDKFINFYDIKIYKFKDLSDNVYFGGIVLNIDKRKELENQLLSRNMELNRMVENLKITQMRMVQQEKMAGIGQLAAGVAHEINNPLGFVLSNFNVLKDYVKDTLELIEVYDKNLNFLNDESIIEITEKKELIDLDFIKDDIENLFHDTFEGLERMGEIVKSLRSFSRVDITDEYDEFDLNVGIKDTIIIARNEIKYDTEIHEEFGQIPIIRAISGQINQVILNILVNATQSIRKKKNDKNIKEKGNIFIRTYLENDFICCSIKDDGLGIEEENIQKIFLPFFTTKDVGEGTGLGMSISYDIIKNKHEGDIIIKSKYGEGAEFIVKLPLEKEIKR